MDDVMKEKSNMILIGMPGVGKSSIGVVLAKKLGKSFIDSDIVIQQETGSTLQELISQYGAAGFLDIEDRINAALDAENCVIATGGSVVFGRSAMEHFKSIGTVVYLAIGYDDLIGRLGDLDERGVVHKEGQTLKDIYDERSRLYEKYADVTVWEKSAQLRIDEAIDAILKETGRQAREK